MRRAALVALVAGCAAAPVRREAAKVEVSSSLSSPETAVARPVTLTLRCVHDSDVELDLPRFDERLGGLEVRGKGTREERELEEKRLEKVLRVELVSFVPGPFAVPGLSVKWKDASGGEGEEKTSELFLQVRSSLEGEVKLEDLKDVYPPVALPWRPPSAAAALFWLILLAGAVAGAIIIVRAHLRRRRWLRAVGETVLPHERAAQELEKLASFLLGTEDLDEYFIRVSAVVRSYIEGNFSIRAPEQTTEEFLVRAASDDRLSADHKALLRGFLEKCDLVKFARYHPAVKEAEDALEAARRFVAETRPGFARAREMRERLARRALEAHA